MQNGIILNELEIIYFYQLIISQCTMNNTKILFALFSLFACVLAAASHTSNQLWPKPTNYTYDPEGTSVSVSPCSMKFTFNGNDSLGAEQIVNFYQINVFGCTKTDQTKGELVITITNGGQYVATDLKHEKYTLSLPKQGKWALKSDYYVGFLRGFETFSQLFTKNANGTYNVSGLPIAISDSPQFIWRGLMIDTSRYFLDIAAIKKIVDGMLYLKLNVLHWHIVDEDSFPMQVPSAPQLSDYGSIGGVYSQNDLKSIISYAKTRGIRVVPQIDTPAHTLSWGRSSKFGSIALNCNGKYEGQFDPTLDLTWEVVSKVFTYVNSTFDDNYIHFGGDEVNYDCWEQRPSIKQFMNAKAINDYPALATYYRQQQKTLYRSTISPNKKVIYWTNEDIDLPVQDQDVLHWWGDQANQNRLSGRKNQVILSNYDVVYLDAGFTNQYGDNYGVYHNWRSFYNFNPIIPNANVIGGTTCMWATITSKYILEQATMQRASALSERLWNTNISLQNDIVNIATRLQAQTERLRTRGFKMWPVTAELCEQDMSLCF